MTDTKQPEALRLAEILEGDYCQDWFYEQGVDEVAAELRRQHARIAELEQEVAHTDSLLGKANALARIRAHRIAELEAIAAGGVSGPPAAQAEGWISVEDARKPPTGKPVVFWVWAERYQEDDEGRQIAQDASGLHLGEWRESEYGNYFDNYSTPFADREAVLWWMDPAPPTSADGVEHG